MSKEVVFKVTEGVSNVLTVFAGDLSKPCILIAPAMGVPARTYLVLAAELQLLGYSAATFDMRGIGQSSIRAGRDNDFGYFDLVSEDFPAAVKALEAELPNRQLVLFGHSLGGQLSCLYLSQNPNAATALILSASCSVHHKGWGFPYNVSLLFFSQLAALIARIVGYFPGKKLGFGGREARGLMIDWANNARNGRYRLLNTPIDFESDLKKVNLPVLALNYNDDNLAPPRATKLLLSKLENSNISYLSVSAEELELKRADHFSWVGAPKLIAHKIDQWINHTLA
ncbi:MAG: putative alpha/beta hydrolase [Cryomorphaceae bacterium]|jgi:predicted alpha/beta hydrolase